MINDENKKVINKKNEREDNFLNNFCYKTGIFCRKVVGIGNVAETEPLKKMTTATKELYETVAEKTSNVFETVRSSVKNNTEFLEESFKAGMESVTENKIDHKTVNIDEPDHKKTTDPVRSKPVKAASSKASTSLKKKAADKIKDKAKVSTKKVKPKGTVEKNAPANADLEKEIEKMTANVTDIEN